MTWSRCLNAIQVSVAGIGPRQLAFVLVMCLLVGACTRTTFREVHALQPVASRFDVAAPALPAAVAALGMQVAQSSPAPHEIIVTALTPEGVRVQITLRPSSETTSTLDVSGDHEAQALAQLAIRLAEALAEPSAQQSSEPPRGEGLEQLGYVAPEPER